MAVFLGDSLIMFLVYLGVATLINTSPILFNLMSVFSAGFLLYLAIQIIYGTYFAPKSTNAISDNADSPPLNRNMFFTKTLLLSLMNPKATLFFIAFFYKFIDPTFSPTYIPFLILASIITLISFLYLSILIFSGITIVNFVKNCHWFGVFGNTLVSIIFILFSVQISYNLIQQLA